MSPRAHAPWRPSASIERLRLRAAVLGAIRSFFAARGVLEVDTPALGAAAATDPHLASLATTLADGRRLWLQTSPEGHMKRLVAAGSGPLYQIARAFRDAERGSRHNPEFLLLEWYRPGFALEALMEEVEALVATVLGPARCARLAWGEALRRHAGVDGFADETHALRAACRDAGLDAESARALDRDGCLDLLVSRRVAPALPGRVFLHDFPASQAAQARIREGPPAVAERFELLVGGVEIANGYAECTAPDELAARFERDRALRRRRGLDDAPADEALIEAMRHGLPRCAGVALGVDRLIMLAAGASAIDEVLPFPVERA